MKRDILKIDEELCNGCGECVPNCHEGALQVIDGKVRLVSELMCDGLGACIGHCPLGAIEIEKREAEPYDEILVIKNMIPKGYNTLLAHLLHLKDHNEEGFLNQALDYLTENEKDIELNIKKLIAQVKLGIKMEEQKKSACGCPGSAAKSFERVENNNLVQGSLKSELTQWPIQLHLLNPQAGYLNGSDILLAADCVAFSLGNFHQDYLKGKKLAIACPKLDDGQDSYVNKLVSMIDDSKINTLTVMIMEVPCCGGLQHIAQTAASRATRKVPIKVVRVGIQGDILSENWV